MQRQLHIYHCIGAAIQVDDVITQASVGWSEQNANTAMVGQRLVDDRYACSYSFASALQAIQISNITASGFDVTTRVEGGAFFYGYLAFKFNGVKRPFLQIVDTPTTASTVAHPDHRDHAGICPDAHEPGDNRACETR